MKKSFLLKSFAVALGGIMALSATGCGSAGEDAEDNAVVFYHYAMTTTLNAQLEEKLSAFTAETGVAVKHVSVSKDNYNATISTKLSSRKKDMDIIYLDQPLLAKYAKSNLLYNIDEYVTEDAGDDVTVLQGEKFLFNKNVFNDSAWQTVVYNGSTYALPLTMNTSVFYYNVATIKQATGAATDAEAVSAVQAIKTWADLKAFANTVNNLGTEYALFGGMSDGGYMGWYSQVFIAAAGGKMYDDTTKTVMPDNDGSITRAFEMIKYMYDKSPKEVYNSATGFKGAVTAPAGKVLFSLADSSAIKDLNVSYTTFGAIPIPGETEQIGSKSNIGGENLVITQKSDKKENALKLMKYLMTEECATMFQQCTNNFSAIDKFAKIDTFSTDTASSTYKMYNVVKNSLGNAQVRPVVDGWLQVNDNGIPTNLKKYIDEEFTVDNALEAIRSYAAQWLK